MRHLKQILLVALCCPFQMHGQGQPLAQVPFAGCYQIVSQTWQPGNEDVKMIPDRFQLLSESTFEPSRRIFAVRSTPASGNVMAEKLWVWQPRGSSLWISWGTGLGGVQGSFKRLRTGEFVGKLKEWCDNRCEWKRRVGTIRIQHIGCTEAASPD